MTENDIHKIRLLKQDLVKYSKQIGIIDCEIPELVFYGRDFNENIKEIYEKHGISQKLDYLPGGPYDDHPRGIAVGHKRIIFVNLNPIEPLADTYPYLRFCLIHELVHYRFRYIPHGSRHMKRIERILLQGKKYSRKHITVPQVPYK
jgi:hypothetical protein